MVEEDFGVSADDGEQIVGVVGDASGEAADGFHFLRLTELIFEDAALGDVFGDGFENVGGFVTAGYGASADADGDGGSVFALPADFETVHASGALEFVDQAGVLTGFDEDVFLRIEGQNITRRVVAEHSDEGGVDVEKAAFEAGAVDSVDRGLHQRAVADFGAAQGLLVAFAVDGGGQLVRDESEDIFVALTEADVFGITLENERAQDVMVDLEGDPQPLRWRQDGEFDFAALLHLLREFGSAEQGFTGAQDILDQAQGKLSGRGSGLLLVDEVGEAEQFGFLVVNCDGEIAGGHEFVDDAVGGGEELLEILRGAGLFGDAIESGAEGFGALALGNVAIDGVEGDGAAFDDQGSG